MFLQHVGMRCICMESCIYYSCWELVWMLWRSGVILEAVGEWRVQEWVIVLFCFYLHNSALNSPWAEFGPEIATGKGMIRRFVWGRLLGYNARNIWMFMDSKTPAAEQCFWENKSNTYNVEHDVVAETWSAVNADQDAVFDGGAETHSQAVRPCARPLVIGPRVCDQAPSFAKDVGGASCGNKKEIQLKKNCRNEICCRGNGGK